MKKLAIITTHPIQYNAPLFKLLTERGKLMPKVFYTWGAEVMQQKFDPGFGKAIQWDIPMLEGYEYAFLQNVSNHPGSHHFKGIDNPRLIKEVEKWGAEAVLVYGWSYKSHLNALRYFSGRIPVFFRGDSTLLGDVNPLKAFARKIFLKWVYRYVDTALYVGTHNKNYYKEYGLKESQLIFAPHSVDSERFNRMAMASNADLMKKKNQLGIEANGLIFLYAGKIDANKNTNLLLEAFCEISDARVHLIVAGNGLLEKGLKELYASHKNIHFMSFVNQQEMPALYNLCNVFVLPSLSETWGLGINEAMSCNKAIIASSGCGAAKDLVFNAVNGYVFINNNLEDLIKKMQACCRDPGLVLQMGEASGRIIKEWSYERVCEALEAEFLN